MLELRAIRKAYTTASLTQVALNDVSVAFRDNEFVAILGQSGSGKTTMLNIIGGLDQFDSGDLLIDGISTQKYKDRDWDTYRNNRIGFVFQAYNLIPHQSILSNVELALTLSGVSRSERKARALAALTEVGLAEHVHKKPNQLSGGQMQRVAIARALVNDPEILLADEPTGALDSETSLQVMDLLKEVAKDRLVIMVTHNPDLAHQYATRIVELADGQVIGDSHPFTPQTEGKRTAKETRKAKMSFSTALALSFSNLMTKKGRTIMTAFAGSIGIIGIAAILSLANGVNEYIERSEEELLTSYPLTIDKIGFDFAGLIAGGDTSDTDSAGGTQSETSSENNTNTEDQAPSGTVITRPVINDSLGQVNSNDLKSLREFIESDHRIAQHSQAIDYTYKIEPLIYLPLTNPTSKGKPTAAHPSSLLDTPSFANEIPSQLTAGANTDTFRALPSNEKIYSDDLELLDGKLPSAVDELLVVLPRSGQLPDVMELNMGLRDRAEVDKLIKERTKNARQGNKDTDKNQSEFTPESPRQYAYADFMGLTYQRVNVADRYTWDENLKVWTDKSDDEKFMSTLINNGQTLRVVGVARNSTDKDVPALQPGIYYTHALISEVMARAADSKIVQDQKLRPELNIFTGNRFDKEQSANPLESFDMSKLMKIDENKISQAFGGGGANLENSLTQAFAGLDFSDMDLSGLDLSQIDPDTLKGAGMGQMPNLSQLDLNSLDLSGMSLPPVDPSKIDVNALQLQETLAKYPELTQVDVSGIVGDVLDKAQSETQPADLAQSIVQALASDPVVQKQGTAFLSEVTGKLMGEVMKQAGPGLAEEIVTAVGGQVQSAVEANMAAIAQQFQAGSEQAMAQLAQALQQQISTKLEQAMGSLGGALDGFAVDEQALAEAFQLTADAEDLGALFNSLLSGGQDTYERNLKRLGYGELDNPDGISIYPKSFQDKEDIKAILDQYNEEQKQAQQDEKVITYSDLVGALMSQVTTIVNMVSAMLIAFVAISLVVSSIMIGIITYISVLERKKEIGILRSIGASKRDIRHVFNAETVLIGFLAGVIGIGTTLALIIPANIIIEQQLQVERLVVLPVSAAVILIAISVFLTWIAGLLPANKAAKADPVEALRSE